MLVALTLGLIAIGGLVTSHGAGMAVPDWPNSYGYNMFAFPISQWVGGILYEHTHRLWASLVGFITLLLAISAFGRFSLPWLKGVGILLVFASVVLVLRGSSTFGNQLFLGGVGLSLILTGFLWRAHEPLPLLFRKLSLLALALVVLQGLLGGLRVVLYKDQIGILHAMLAQLFFCLSCIIAWHCVRGGRSGFSVTEEFSSATKRFVYFSALMVFAQLAVGAVMRHQHAGLAIPDFPLAYGRMWPPTDPGFLELINKSRLDDRDFLPITAMHIQLQMAHRITALAIVALLVISVARIWKESSSGSVFRRWALAGMVLVLVQFCLGAATVWTNKAADVATLHVLTGACMLAWVVLFGLQITFLRATTEKSTRAESSLGSSLRCDLEVETRGSRN